MPRRAIAPPLLLLWLLVSSPAAWAASISGVCPDGSIFIVQDRERIPCDAAKEVAPSEVPPLRPQYLPRPYAWQVYREQASPNNPYNLIDSARRVRSLQDGLAPGASGVDTEVALPAVSGAAPGPQGPVPGRRGEASVPLSLSADDVRDLFLIVELSQRGAPARFLKEDAFGELAMEISFAWSAAFETRFREAAPGTSGPVLLFTVLAHRESEFHPNFTFVQGHETFRPRIESPSQMGLLEGDPGALPAEGVVLGYVVLPAWVDLHAPADLYWNDRRTEAVLRP